MTLSEKQRRLIETAMQPGVHRTITAMCAEAGVTLRTYYRWSSDDGEFRAAWEDAWRGSLGRHLPGVVAAVVHKALTGDMRAARLVADMAGAITRQSHVSIEVAVRREAERVAAEMGLDPAEVMAEAEAILREGDL